LFKAEWGSDFEGRKKQEMSTQPHPVLSHESMRGFGGRIRTNQEEKKEGSAGMPFLKKKGDKNVGGERGAKPVR